MTQHLELDPQWLENVYRALESGGYDPQGVVVVQSGKTLASASWEPYRLNEPALVYSVSKTFSAAAIGFAAQEGLVDLHQPAWKYLLDQEPAGPRARNITVHHLLAMDTGHSAEQINAAGPPYELTGLLDVEPEHEPGTWFEYNSCASFLLSAIVQRLTGEHLTDYLRPRLLDPLGFGERWWRPNGEYDQGFSGFHITTGEIAAMAGAYLGWGTAAGSNPLPAGWAELSARSHADNSNQDSSAHSVLGYGYQVWRGQHGFRLDGAYGQWGLIIPELDLVIAYRGSTHRTSEVLQIWWEELVTKWLAAGAGVFPAVPTDRSATVAPSALTLSIPSSAHSARQAPISLPLPADAEQPPSPVAAQIVADPREVEVQADGAAVLRLGEFMLPLEAGWSRHKFPVGEGFTLRLAASGDFLPDGGWHGAVFATSTCHRLALSAPLARSGEPGVFPVEVAWVTEPLWRPHITDLVVPNN